MNEAGEPPTARPEAPRPPRRRRWRWLWLLPVLLLLAAIGLPHVVSPLVRAHLLSEWAARTTGKSRIDEFHLGWSGFTVGGVELADDRPGTAGRPMLSLRRATGSWSWPALFAGRVDLEAEVRGLHLRIDQRSDGTTNVGRVLGLGDGAPGPSGGGGGGGGGEGEGAERVRLQLEVHDSRIELSREGELLETLDALTLQVDKPYGGRMALAFGASLAPLQPGQAAGRVELRADVDTGPTPPGPVFAGSLVSRGLDLARWRPLVAALWPDALTALEGVVEGELRLRAEAGSEAVFRLAGELRVAAPRIAGKAIGGLDVHAEQWLFRPDLEFAPGAAGNLRSGTLRSGTLHLDLGFLQVDAAPEAASGDRSGGGATRLRAEYRADLDRIAAFGGGLGETVTSGGTLAGTAVLPLEALLPLDAEAVLRALSAEARLQGAAVAAAGLAAAGVEATLALEGGRLTLATGPGTRLNGGPLELELGAELLQPGRPFELGLGWRGGRVDGSAAPALRYLVPLLAGAGDAAAGLAATADLTLGLRGPSWPEAGENLLQWLDRFAAEGELTLREGSFAPAPPLQELLALLGQQQRLAIDRIHGSFRLRAGAITSEAMRWLSAGREYGLSGTVHLDGELDYGIDVTAVLLQHRDGRAIAAFLGDQPLRAGLGGTLQRPELRVPDLAELLRRAIEQAPGKLLEEQGGELLRRGLERLFGGK